MNKFKGTISNIFAVIKSDIKRLSKSVVAVVCVFGLALVPCLYSWFNIMSNWDPYTEDATQNLKIAVTSEDRGTTFVGMDFNVGNIIIQRLESNNQIDWQFPESTQELMDGLNSGEYYAGLVIPTDFSENVLGFTDGDVEKASITFYENQKLNAVASRVTDRAKGIIEDEINGIFLATIVDEMSTFTSLFSGVGTDANAALDDLDEQLENIKTDLRTYISIMDSMSSVTQSAASVTSMTNALLPDVIELLAQSRQTVSDMQDRLATTKEDVIYAADSIRNTSEEIRNAIERLDEATNGNPGEAGSSYVDWDAIYGEGGISDYEGEILDDLYYDVNKQLHDSAIRFDEILKQTNIDGNLVASISTLQDSLTNLDSLLATIENDVDGQSITLAQFTHALNTCTASINGTKEVMGYMLDIVENLQLSINELRSSESFNEVLDLMSNDIEGLVDYLSSPANLEVVRVYPVDHNGSGMTPYYTVLAIYASALLSVSLLHTRIKRRDDLPELSNTEAFFGRYFVFFAVGQFTALITVLGNLFYIGIQCYDPFLFWLVAAITSLLFTLINYSLVYAFGNIGEALSIIILVIQVAGSGGTYPMEMLPKPFQVLYSIMPFNYSMNAMRETIAGHYDHTYLKCILVLLLMCIIFIFIGIFGGKLFNPIRNRFAKSKEKTGIMHGG